MICSICKKEFYAPDVFITKCFECWVIVNSNSSPIQTITNRNELKRLSNLIEESKDKKIEILEQLVKELMSQLERVKKPKIWTPIKQELITYLMEEKKVYDNEENESDRYNEGLCYKHDTALQIILDLPTEG